MPQKPKTTKPRQQALQTDTKSLSYQTFPCFYESHAVFLQKSLFKQTMELQEIMKSRREKLSLSQRDLAEMAGVSLATIKDIERGKGNPSLTTIQKILEILGLEIDYRIRQTV